jgi:hypothetical protein
MTLTAKHLESRIRLADSNLSAPVSCTLAEYVLYAHRHQRRTRTFSRNFEVTLLFENP